MKGDVELVFIQQAIDITLLVLEKKIEGFNPNNFHSYIGIDDIAMTVFRDTMKKLYSEEIEIIHGEMKHNCRLKSDDWYKKHIWCKYKQYYIDITVSQFLPILKDVPQFYISPKKPKWFISYNELGKHKWMGSKLWVSICDSLNKIFYKEGK